MNYIVLTLYKNILNEIPLFRLLHIHYEFVVNGTYFHSMTTEITSGKVKCLHGMML